MEITTRPGPYFIDPNHEITTRFACEIVRIAIYKLAIFRYNENYLPFYILNVYTLFVAKILMIFAFV